MVRNLSPKEKVIFDYLKKGLSAYEISKIQGITENGVKFHFTNIYRKFKVANRAELLTKIIWLYEQGQATTDVVNNYQPLPMPENQEGLKNAE